MVSVAGVASQSSNAGSGQPSVSPVARLAQAADPDWLNKYATPVSTVPVVVPAPSAALAEQINLGARAFAEFNDTLSRIMDYGLIKTWGERNALREEELGLPLSGWTGKEVTNPTVSAAPQAQVATQPLAADGTPESSATTAIASSVDTESPQSVPVNPVEPAASSTASPSLSSAAGSVAGVFPLTVEPMTVASEEATESTSPSGNQPPELPVSPSVAQQGSGAAATSDAPLATTSSTEAAPATPNAAAPPGPLPSLSSLTTASSHSSSSWIAPNSWYVSDELYAVRRAATEQYRQMHLGTLQKNLFDEA